MRTARTRGGAGTSNIGEQKEWTMARVADVEKKGPSRTILPMHALTLALLAAVLFGASAPASKLLLSGLQPFQLAGLLYLGAALGAAPWALRAKRSRKRATLNATNRRRLAGSVIFGGVLGPVLLLLALNRASAGSVSLLLNLEIVATALLGVGFFREYLGRSGWLGIAAILCGGSILSFEGGTPGLVAGALAAAACTCWGLDNNLTALIDGLSPSEITFWKGIVAGSTNLLLGLVLAPLVASPTFIAGALVVGMFSYGASIVLYITAAQQIGAARSQAVFASAPFVGAAISFAMLNDPFGAPAVVAGLLFAVGVVLAFLDRHEHAHAHEACTHIHAHRHDEGHHDHEHAVRLPLDARHTHEHSHAVLAHAHRHLPDLHHRHGH
jgi:drug/metabolite transporter (DMT)-like permease